MPAHGPNCNMTRPKGPSLNDVTALGLGGMKDFVTTVLKPDYLVTMGRRVVKNYQQQRDVIYGQPFSDN